VLLSTVKPDNWTPHLQSVQHREELPAKERGASLKRHCELCDAEMSTEAFPHHAYTELHVESMDKAGMEPISVEELHGWCDVCLEFDQRTKGYM